MNEFWHTVGNIGAFASILALPLTLWQLWGVRKEVKESQRTVDSLVESMKHEKLSEIKEILYNQHDAFLRVKGKMNERGYSEKSTKESLYQIIIELNHCDHELPTGFDDVSKAIQFTIASIQNVIAGEKDKINECDEAFRKTILVMKTISEDWNTNRIKSTTKL